MEFGRGRGNKRRIVKCEIEKIVKPFLDAKKGEVAAEAKRIMKQIGNGEHRMKKYATYIMPSVLLIGITVLGYRKIRFCNEIWASSVIDVDMVVIALYFLWIVSEIKVSGNDIKQKKTISDYGTREIYGTSQFVTILSALWFDSVWSKPGIFHIIGFVIFVFGGLFRIWAVTTLGKYYSHTVRKIKNHKIIDIGPYRLLRHPAYTGMIAAHFGIMIFYFNFVTAVLFFVLLIPSIIVRIFIEEKALKSIKGYSEFSKKENG